MTTNKPHIEAYLVTRIKGQGYGKPRRILDAEVYDPTSDSFFAPGAKENYTVEPLVSLSKYEVLQAECEKLRKDAERYQWLRDGNNEENSEATIIAANFWGDRWDNMIDNAMEPPTAYCKGEKM